MTDLGIRTAGLTKYYGDRRGIEDLDLEVRQGEIFGFVGPNGAGKTTTMRLLLGLLRPTSGSLELLGASEPADLRRARARVGYMPGDMSLYQNLTGMALLRYLGRLRGGVPVRAIHMLSERLDLDLSRHVHDLSRGNRQKLGVVQAFMHQPDLLVLDEPTSGLDPVVQQEFAGLVHESVHRGAAVLLSSHVLAEVEELADRVGIVIDGRLGVVDRVDALKQRSSHLLVMEFAQPVGVAAFAGLPGVRAVETRDTTVSCTVVGPMTTLLATAVRLGVLSVVSREPDLERIFLDLVAGGDGNGVGANHGAVARHVA